MVVGGRLGLNFEGWPYDEDGKVRNKENDWLIDREEQKDGTIYTGIRGFFNNQDIMATPDCLHGPDEGAPGHARPQDHPDAPATDQRREGPGQGHRAAVPRPVAAIRQDRHAGQGAQCPAKTGPSSALRTTRS